MQQLVHSFAISSSSSLDHQYCATQYDYSAYSCCSYRIIAAAAVAVAAAFRAHQSPGREQ
eukprot:15106-Heterococcus_DN1.PRE.3